MNINNGSLQKYSNKFCNMIKMLNKEPDYLCILNLKN